MQQVVEAGSLEGVIVEIEQLTPAERDEVQMLWLHHHLKRQQDAKHPKGTRRTSDRVGPVKHYDAAGNRV